MAPQGLSLSQWRPPQVSLKPKGLNLWHQLHPHSLISTLFAITDLTYKVLSHFHNIIFYLLPPGVISVYFEANVSSNKPQGFNASFWVRRCHQSSDEGEEGSPVCPGGAQCQSGLCQCPQGYGGPHCDRPMCPQDCGIAEGRGACNIVRIVAIYIKNFSKLVLYPSFPKIWRLCKILLFSTRVP